jgi:hypothetical protein
MRESIQRRQVVEVEGLPTYIHFGVELALVLTLATRAGRVSRPAY